jgi:hypothetical protein
MYSLIFHSLALINPSKSEGWSNTVEQARLIKKKVLLSYNSVHLEQKSKNFIYFQPDNYIKLSQLLKKHSKSRIKLFAFTDRDILKIEESQKEFVNRFLEIIK